MQEFCLKTNDALAGKENLFESVEPHVRQSKSLREPIVFKMGKTLWSY